MCTPVRTWSDWCGPETGVSMCVSGRDVEGSGGGPGWGGCASTEQGLGSPLDSPYCAAGQEGCHSALGPQNLKARVP